MTSRPRSLRHRLMHFSAIGMIAGVAPALFAASAFAQSAAPASDQSVTTTTTAAKTAATTQADKSKPVLVADTTVPAAATPIADAGATATPPPASAEQITVTGSRVKRTNLESTSPVVTVTSADIQAKGITQTADIINQLPQAGVATVSNVSSNFSDDAAGLQIVNLRNLGSDRTLVLIDGRRTVGGLAPGQGGPGNSSGVDISTIPAYLIDKVDVVTGGGSSAYGSEAVAGVVNFRLKQSFNGFLMNQQYGATSDEGDSRTTTTDILMGSDFADDRGHAIFAAEYQDQGIVKSADRPFSAIDINNGGLYSPSSFTPYGSVLTDNGRFVITGPNSIAPYSADTYGFNREALRTIQIPTTQLDTYSKLSYDVLPNMTLFADFKFSRTTATSILEPIALGAGQGSTTIGFAGDVLTVPLTNPYIPAALAAQGIVDDGAGGIGDFRRRFLELGDRGSDDTRYNYGITVGTKGELYDRFNYEAYYSHSETTSTQVESNSGNVLNLQNALDATTINGQIVCSDPSARAAGCIPIDLFGKGQASQAALNYIRAIKTYNDDLTQDDVQADIGGPVYTLPYGDVRLNVGFEHRREDASSTPDALTASGFGLDTSGPATRGGYSVTDFFAEGLVPILKDLPFAKSLTVDAGYRRSYYSLSSVGVQESYKYGGSYAPVSDIVFRIENAVAIRAPTVSDLYTGRTQSATSVVDPCSNNGLSGLSGAALGTRIAGCNKIPGITPGFTEDQANQQTEISYSSGNPNLTAERARVFTYGVVLQPRYVPRFSMSVDAFKYFIADAISDIDLQTTANECVDTGNAAFCDLVRRDPSTGIIQGVDSKAINVGSIREQGVDVQLNYELRMPSLAHYMFRNVDDIGAIDFSWNYEYLQYLNQVSIPGNVTEETGDFGAPKNKWTFDALYRDDKFQLNYQMRYIGEQRYDFYGTGPNFANRFYSDMSIRYQFTKKIAAYAGIRNMFDRQPPQVDQNYQQTGAGVASGVTGTNTVPDVYDAIGRYIYAGVHVQF